MGHYRQWIEFERDARDEYGNWLLPDWQREILADYWVNDAEIAFVKQLFVDCIARVNPNVTVEFDDLSRSGFSSGVTADVVSAIGVDEAIRLHDYAFEQCEFQYLQPIHSIWRLLMTNPEGLTMSEAIGRCWSEHGLEAPVGFGEDWLTFNSPAEGDVLWPCFADPFRPQWLIAAMGGVQDEKHSVIDMSVSELGWGDPVDE